MQLPRISIVTPSYNQGNFLEGAIESVLAQDYPNLEYVVIDGGSTDQSYDIIKFYSQHLAYWVSESDKGQSQAINKGLLKTSGELVTWLNADDRYLPGALHAVAQGYLANPGIGAIVGAGQMTDETGDIIDYRKPTCVTVQSLYRWLQEFFWQPSCFLTRAAWDTCGPLDERLHYALDLDLWLKVAAHFPFVCISELLSQSFRHDSAKTFRFKHHSLLEAVLIISRHGGEEVALAELSRYADFLAEKDDVISNILSSNSWRLTSPLRSFRQILRSVISPEFWS